MIRIILFLLLIALAAAGAAWVADQPGDVVLSWGGCRAQTTLPVFVLVLGIVVVAAMMLWAILRGCGARRQRMRKSRRERRHARGRHAITQGLLAIGLLNQVRSRYADLTKTLGFVSFPTYLKA